jgi:putative transcription factor
MLCEVCGREIFGEPYHRIIEGGRMTVCSRCAQFGSKEWDPRRPRGLPQRRRSSTRPRNAVEAQEEMELVENYGALIRRTRQRKGMKVEDLAKKINEKESVIKKLEQEELTPNNKLVTKVNRALNIQLMERATKATGPVLSRPIRSRTLGDLVDLKKQDEEG